MSYVVTCEYDVRCESERTKFLVWLIIPIDWDYVNKMVFRILVELSPTTIV